MTKFWQWLSGKKVALGAIFYTFKDLIAPIWFNGGLPHPWDKIILTIATVFTVTGFAHKVQKWQTQKREKIENE